MSTATATVTTDTTTETLAPATGTPLTAMDRCDSPTRHQGIEIPACGAQAFIRATSSATNYTLLFCKHHGDRNLTGLAAQGFAIEDFSERINKQASESSPL